MKHLKKFNESDNSNYYYEIPLPEWNRLYKTFEEDILNERDLSEIEKAINQNDKIGYRISNYRPKKMGKEMWYKRYVSPSYTDKIGVDIVSYTRNLVGDPIHEFHITKYTDEWYVVIMVGDPNFSPVPSVPFGVTPSLPKRDRKVFRCDQLEGLTKFLKDNI
jgi:hypothetical protein